MTIPASLSANKVTSQLQENLFADVHDDGVTIRHVYGHSLNLGVEGQARLLATLLTAKVAQINLANEEAAARSE